MLHDGALSGDLRNDGRLPCQQFIKRLDNVDPWQSSAGFGGASRPAQRTGKFHLAASIAYRRNGVLRNTAITDQPDRSRHSRMPVNFHCDSSSIV